jgi:hypothetical protein
MNQHWHYVLRRDHKARERCSITSTSSSTSRSSSSISSNSCVASIGSSSSWAPSTECLLRRSVSSGHVESCCVLLLNVEVRQLSVQLSPVVVAQLLVDDLVQHQVSEAHQHALSAHTLLA